MLKSNARAAAVCALLMLWIAATGASQEKVYSARESLDYLVGSWSTEYEMEGMGRFREEVTYTRGENENTVEMSMKVVSDGKVIERATGTMTYDPRGNVVSTIVSSDTGAVYRSAEIRRDGNISWFEGTATGSPGFSEYRIRIEIVDHDICNWTMLTPDGEGGYKDFLTVVYKRMEKPVE